LDAAAAAPILKAITSATGFGADLDHLSVHGLCAACRAAQGDSRRV
jgi:Fe2+ or Zn2+ uptake regulation protein